MKAAGILITLLFAISPLPAQVLMTRDEALTQVFPDSQNVTRHTIFLNDSQVDRIQKRAHTKLESRIMTYYTDSATKKTATFVFFEKNRVRTKDEIFMVVVNADGTVKYIEMLAFYEPFDYFPMARWLKLFIDKPLTKKLWPNRDINNITGATLTAHAITFGVRKILAIYDIAIRPPEWSRNVILER